MSRFTRSLRGKTRVAASLGAITVAIALPASASASLIFAPRLDYATGTVPFSIALTNHNSPTCAPLRFVGCHSSTFPSSAADASRNPRCWYASAVRFASQLPRSIAARP